MKYIRAALSTWASTSKYFGLDVLVYYESDPISQFKLNLTIMPNAEFTKVGFSVVLICQDYDTIAKIFSFYMDVHKGNVTQPAYISSISNSHVFI